MRPRIKGTIGVGRLVYKETMRGIRLMAWKLDLDIVTLSCDMGWIAGTLYVKIEGDKEENLEKMKKFLEGLR